MQKLSLISQLNPQLNLGKRILVDKFDDEKFIPDELDDRHDKDHLDIKGRFYMCYQRDKKNDRHAKSVSNAKNRFRYLMKT